eukprot:gene12562-14845_t
MKKVYMQQLDILVHEILHGLVMDDGLYDYFIDSSGKRLGKHNVVQNFTERGVRVHKIVTPKVREAAAAQLACTPLNGAELENEGGLNMATEPRALRIHVDMQLSNLDASLSAYVEEELAPAAVAAISRYIQVKEPMPGALQLPRVCAEYVTLYNGTVLCSSVEPIDTCGEGDWTATHNASYFAGYEICDCPDAAETSPDVDCTCTFTEGGGGVPDVDFVLYVTSGYLQACERSTVAVGSYCSQDVSNHRPLAGQFPIILSRLAHGGLM